jgi:hypothetical protein
LLLGTLAAPFIAFLVDELNRKRRRREEEIYLHPAFLKRAAAGKTKSDLKSVLNNPAVWGPLTAAGATIGGVLATKVLTESKKVPVYAKPVDPVDDAYLYRYGLGNYLLKQQEEKRRRGNVYKGTGNR